MAERRHFSVFVEKLRRSPETPLQGKVEIDPVRTNGRTSLFQECALVPFVMEDAQNENAVPVLEKPDRVREASEVGPAEVRKAIA